LAVFLLVPLLTLEALRFAHRLVGPLYRFRKTLRAIGAGEAVGLVELRNGDMLQDFKDDLNAMLKRLEQQGAIVLKTPKAAEGAVWASSKLATTTNTPEAAEGAMQPQTNPGTAPVTGV
jgi:hypothetical protein